MRFIEESIKKKKPFRIGAAIYFLAFAVMIFVQMSDYFKSYLLYVRAKAKLIKMYKEGASVATMNDQADIVEYLHTLAIEGIRQAFYTTATFTFIAITFIAIVWTVRKMNQNTGK